MNKHKNTFPYKKKKSKSTDIFLKNFIAIILFPITLTILLVKRNKQKNGQPKEKIKPQTTISTEKEKHYQAKSLLTPTERKYFEAIKLATPNNYIVYPQINLATIIDRVDEHKYQNELYRNIDFAIFDTFNRPVLLIEINDNTHKEPTRIERDRKVKEICKKANIPLITFWTSYGINQEYIKKQIANYCT